MALGINTNVASLTAQNQLTKSQDMNSQALERLSSGLRINSAKDDAAGLAISERFSSQIRGLNVAARNANDGISLAQTAEGAMDEITNNLQRIRELSVQAANATNSISDRQALNQEVQQRVEEINRIASQTSFNGLKVLDGTFGTQTFQVGANTGETIGISGLDSRGSQIGSVIKKTENMVGFARGETRLNVSNLDFNAALTVTGTIGTTDISAASGDYSSEDDPAAAFAAALQSEIRTQSGLDEVTVEVSDDGVSLIINNPTAQSVAASFTVVDASGTAAQEFIAIGTTLNEGGGNDAIDLSSLDFTNGGKITIGGVEVEIDPLESFSLITRKLQTLLQSEIDPDLTATFNNPPGEFVITNTAAVGTPAGENDITLGKLIVIEDGTGTFNNTTGGAINTIAGTDETTLANKFEDNETYSFQVGINGTKYRFENIGSLNDLVSQVNAKSNETGIQANLDRNNDEIYFSSQFGEPFSVNIQADLDNDGTFNSTTETVQSLAATIEDDSKPMNDIDISTPESADIAMIAVDYAIDTINSFRAKLGAVQNRFESTIANLATTTENLSASNSRIRDADFAAESAELARTQVLQQAGLSVLAQANARPQQVLQLLQG